MNVNKRNTYKLFGGVQTLSITTDKFLQKQAPNTIKECVDIAYYSNRKVTSIKINPNKLHGDINTFSELKDVLQYIFTELEIGDFKITRIDFKLDSTELGHYKAYEKLNRYIISMLSMIYKVKNRYRTTDLLTLEQISVACKNNAFEIEHYDKAHQMHGNGTTTSRLEIRSKRLSIDNLDDIQNVFMESWERRFDKMLLYGFSELENYLAQKLYDKYKENLADYNRFEEFLFDNRLYLYKGSLTTKLYELAEIPNAENRAKDFKRRKANIEYFSKADVRYAVDEIKRCIDDFFRV